MRIFCGRKNRRNRRFHLIEIRAMLKKGYRFCAISYLIARLQMALETSRLAVFRMKPQIRIVQSDLDARILLDDQWLCAETRTCYVYQLPSFFAPTIRILQEASTN